MDFNQTFGSIVKQTRKQKKLSQEHLGHLIESNQRYISEIESGSRHPSLRICYDIAVALETPLSELIRQAEELVAANE